MTPLHSPGPKIGGTVGENSMQISFAGVEL